MLTVIKYLQLHSRYSLQECDLGEKSIIHAVKNRLKPVRITKESLDAPLEEEFNEEEASANLSAKPLCETLVDLQLNLEERINIAEDKKERSKAHFFVYCSQCSKISTGKLRVRCNVCKGGAFTVHRDPENWDDVLKPKRITGQCETLEIACIDNEGPPFAEFYFKCAEHPSGGEKDYAAPLNLIKINLKNVPCLACTDVT